MVDGPSGGNLTEARSMAKHDPGGEICPHCPPGTPVGFCVRHLLGWDPEPALPSDVPRYVLKVNLAIDGLDTFLARGGLVAGTIVHAKVGATQIDGAGFYRADRDHVVLFVLGQQIQVPWVHLDELWPL